MSEVNQITNLELIAVLIFFILIAVFFTILISFLWTISRKIRKIKTSYEDIKFKINTTWQNHYSGLKIIAIFIFIIIFIKLIQDMLRTGNPIYGNALTAVGTIALAIVTYYSTLKSNQMAKQTFISRQAELELHVLPKIKSPSISMSIEDNPIYSLYFEYLESLSDLNITIFGQGGKKIIPSQDLTYIITQDKFIDKTLHRKSIDDKLLKEDISIDFLEYDNNYKNLINIKDIMFSSEINKFFVRLSYVTKIHNSIVEIYEFDKEKKTSQPRYSNYLLHGQIHYKKYSWEDTPWYPLRKYSFFRDYERILDIKKHEEELDIVDQIKDSFSEFLSNHKTINRIFNSLKKNKN